MCLAMGMYRAGRVVHHIIHLNPENIGNPGITLGWDNLMLLCADHHAQVHRHNERRFFVGADGKIISIYPPIV